MDANFRSDKPGKSPMGMDLVPVYADGEQDESVVRISPAVMNNLGVRTAPVQYGPLAPVIETVGYFEYNEENVAHIHTRAPGWIQNLYALTEGEYVREGELLFEIFSPTLVNAQEEYLSAARGGNASLVAASEERLLALGVPDNEIAELKRTRKVRQRLRHLAKFDGFIAQLGVREGMYVTEASEVMSLADLSTVWLIAEVFQRQGGLVSEGQAARATVESYPGETWNGMVEFVYPALDPVTRTLRARLRFENPGFALRPNMFARITIEGPAHDTLSVPRSALIRGGQLDRVVLNLGDGRFRAQAVTPGFESGDRVAIIKGLEAGQSVVTSAQFLIDSESNLDSALARFSEPE
jgi:Cu(I)/Ag(I) efflux system membrane fusion protein